MILNGNYCHNCGQRKSVKRISVRSLIEDFSSKWIGWDNKFLRTIKGLTINPGLVVRKYIDGNRVSFVGPLGYTLLTTAIMIFGYNIFEINISDLMKSSQEAINGGTPQSEVTMEVTQSLNDLMANNFRYMVMIMIPFISLAGVMFYSGGKRKINYLEQMVLFFYLAGHAIWFNILTIPLLKIFGASNFWILSILSYSYTIFGIYTFHESKGFKGILKAFFCYLVGFTLYFIGITIIGIIYMVFFTDMIEMIIKQSQNG